MTFKTTLQITNCVTPLLKRVGVLFGLLILAGSTLAQGWQRAIGGENPEEGWAVIQDIDGGYLIAGAGNSYGDDLDQDINLAKTDIDGKVIWVKFYDEGFKQTARSIQQTADGNYLIVGSVIANNGDNDDVYLLKVNPQGQKIWSRTYGGDIIEKATDVVTLEDGGFVIVGENDGGDDVESDILVVRFDGFGNARWQKTFGTDRSDVGNAIVRMGSGYALVGNSKNEEGFDNDIVIYRLDEAGEIVWERRLANNFLEEGRDIVATQDNGVAIAGLINSNPDAFVAKFDSSGNMRWTRTIGVEGIEEEANSITELADGSLVIAGIKVQPGGINVDIYLAKLDAGGNQIWERTLGRENYLDEARSVIAASDGGLVIAGYNGPGLSFANDIALTKTDALGNTFTNVIAGQVFYDEDGACELDAEEQGLNGWLVIAEGTEETFYGSTDENGFYSIEVDTGTYLVNVVPENRYWSACSESGIVVEFTRFYDTTETNLGAAAIVECPYLEVDVSTPFLSLCDEVVYTVEYCNLGSAIAEQATVQITLDEKLSFLSSDQAFVEEDNKLIFDIEDVAIGGCGTFTFTANSACTGIARGQAILVEAEIFPDSSCLQLSPDWDGADIRIQGLCDSEENVVFTVTNIGKGPMSVSRSFGVIRDEIILQEDNFSLEPAQEIQVGEFPSGGSTFRLIAEQSPDHPFKTFATAVVEGCGTEIDSIMTGFVTQFPEDDQEPTRSIDVQEVVDPALSVELRGYPKGYKDGIIAQQTDLTYKILLSNTSEDTVDRIVIRDTLSNHLDLTSLEMGASSHPYTAEVYYNGILKITMDNIQLLPYDSAGGASSEIAFVEFKIAQKDNNPKGTIIENRAGVFFDYQSPVTTNVIQHQVDEYPTFVDQLLVNVKEKFLPGVSVNVYPNPFDKITRIELEGKAFKTVRFSLYDVSGRLVDFETFNGNQFDYYRNNLKSGLYYFKLESEGQLIYIDNLLAR